MRAVPASPAAPGAAGLDLADIGALGRAAACSSCLDRSRRGRAVTPPPPPGPARRLNCPGFVETDFIGNRPRRGRMVERNRRLLSRLAGSCRSRRAGGAWFHQSRYSKIAYSSWSTVRHGPTRRMFFKRRCPRCRTLLRPLYRVRCLPHRRWPLQGLRRQKAQWSTNSRSRAGEGTDVAEKLAYGAKEAFSVQIGVVDGVAGCVGVAVVFLGLVE